MTTTDFARRSRSAIIIMCLLIAAACSGGAGSGAGGGGDGAGGSGAGSEGVGASQCAESVSVSQDSEKEEDCVTIAVFVQIQENAALKSLTRLLGEAAATGLDDGLKRANIITNDDAAVAVAYAQQTQLLGGEDVHEVAMRVVESYSNAEILVVMTVAGDPNGLMAARLSAHDKKNGRGLGSVGVSGDATKLGASAKGMGSSLAEKIKDARVCLSQTPVRAVIDFEDESKRKQKFTLKVKNLKNEAVNEGEVTFELAQPEWGSLSRSSGKVLGGELTTDFTMTKKHPNSLEATYKSDKTTQSDSSTIIPLCGWLLIIEGEKVFDLNHASPPVFHTLFGDGAWITITGTNTVSGHVALTVADDEVTVFGTGWMVEKQNTSGGMFTYIYSFDGEGRIIGECSSTSSVTGLAQGEWVVWGTASADTISIQGMATGVAAGGETGSGKCNLAGLSASGGGSNDAGVLSEFHDVTLPLEAGATATATGQGAFLEEKYKYTLTLKRAAK